MTHCPICSAPSPDICPACMRRLKHQVAAAVLLALVAAGIVVGLVVSQ